MLRQNCLLRQYFASALLLVLALFCAACSNTVSVVSLPTTSQATIGSMMANASLVGQSVKVDATWTVVVDSVKVSGGDQYVKAAKGMMYLILAITMNNASSSQQTVDSALQFTLWDMHGQKYSETVNPDAGQMLDDAVSAYASLKGVIVYEVPSTIRQFMLGFRPDMTRSTQRMWMFQT